MSSTVPTKADKHTNGWTPVRAPTTQRRSGNAAPTPSAA